MDMVVVKVLLTIAVTWGVEAIQADVPNAYVQAELESKYDLFMEIPSGMRVSKEMLLDIVGTI